jgi:16S rRNA (guanine(966)-N(2))-methyltransferase RsmD
VRVIAGIYKGRRLEESRSVRATTSKVRGAVFNILQSDIEGAVFLDLFAGTGAMGIEALSRGAKFAYFADLDSELIGKNLSFVPKKDYEVVVRDYKLALKSVRDKVDIIYADPPYFDLPHSQILNAIARSDVLASGGLVLLERSARSAKMKPEIPAAYELLSSRKYGNIAVDVMRMGGGRIPPH